MRRKPSVFVAETLALHPEQTDHEHDLEWAHWIFQGVRARCDSVIFRTSGSHRAAVLDDWGRFSEESFGKVVAPHLLSGWKAAVEGDEAALLAVNASLSHALPEPLVGLSIAAGEILLHDTRGAKYQGTLGHFRQAVEEGRAQPHLAVVWAGLAAMFQMPPLDLLCEYLREEWLVGTRELGSVTPPQGMLSFVGLSQKAMHRSLSLFTPEQTEVRREA